MVTTSKLIPSDIEAIMVNIQMALMSRQTDEYLAHRIAALLLRGDEHKFYSPKVSAVLNLVYHLDDYQVRLSINEMLEYAEIMQYSKDTRLGKYTINMLEFVEQINQYIPTGTALIKYFSYIIGKQDGKLFIAVAVDASYKIMNSFSYMDFNEKLCSLSLEYECEDYWQEREATHLHKYCFTWEN